MTVWRLRWILWRKWDSFWRNFPPKGCTLYLSVLEASFMRAISIRECSTQSKVCKCNLLIFFTSVDLLQFWSHSLSQLLPLIESSVDWSSKWKWISTFLSTLPLIVEILTWGWISFSHHPFFSSGLEDQYFGKVSFSHFSLGFQNFSTSIYTHCYLSFFLQHAFLEGLFAIRKSGFKDYPAIPKELDLVEREDQITFEIGLDEEVCVCVCFNVYVPICLCFELYLLLLFQQSIVAYRIVWIEVSTCIVWFCILFYCVVLCCIVLFLPLKVWCAIYIVQKSRWVDFQLFTFSLCCYPALHCKYMDSVLLPLTI